MNPLVWAVNMDSYSLKGTLHLLCLSSVQRLAIRVGSLDMSKLPYSCHFSKLVVPIILQLILWLCVFASSVSSDLNVLLLTPLNPTIPLPSLTRLRSSNIIFTCPFIHSTNVFQASIIPRQECRQDALEHLTLQERDEDM